MKSDASKPLEFRLLQFPQSRLLMADSGFDDASTKGVARSAPAVAQSQETGSGPPSSNSNKVLTIRRSGAENRRSGRVMLTVPLHVAGRDASGQTFECEARTLSINRYGARIQVSRKLKSGQTIHLTNLINQSVGTFRVVGFLGSSEEGVEEWGVEATDPEPEFWGIYFPPALDRAHESTALVECQECHTIGLLQLSLLETEVIEANGSLSKSCVRCGRDTLWANAENTISPATPPTSAQAIPWPPVEAPSGSLPQRKDHRYYVQRPISLRDASGNIDVTRTENISQSGICCTSERNYETGQELTLIWPNPAAGQNYEARGHVVRRHDIGATTRKIYGIQYDSPAVLQAPPPRSARGLYWRLGAVAISAATLSAIAVFHLVENLSALSESWKTPTEFGAVVLLLYLAHRTRKAILICEPAGQNRWRRRRRIAGAMTALLLTGVVAAAAAFGLLQNSRRSQNAIFLTDLTLSGILEKHIDAAESHPPATRQAYSDVCATLQPLLQQWTMTLRDLSDQAAQIGATSPRNEALQERISLLAKIIDLDQEKARLIEKQVALASSAAQLPPPKQLAFWQANFDPLLSEVQNLNLRRDHLVHTLTQGR